MILEDNKRRIYMYIYMGRENFYCCYDYIFRWQRVIRSSFQLSLYIYRKNDFHVGNRMIISWIVMRWWVLYKYEASRKFVEEKECKRQKKEIQWENEEIQLIIRLKIYSMKIFKKDSRINFFLERKSCNKDSVSL